MADSITTFLLAKLKVVGGPIAAGAIFGATVAWYARGERSTADQLAREVRRIDDATVKRPEFDALVGEFRRYAVRGDSTNALLRRYICREQPAICP